MVMALVLGFSSATEALAFGRSTLMPGMLALLVRMKITSTTSSTSTNGVMLMPPVRFLVPNLAACAMVSVPRQALCSAAGTRRPSPCSSARRVANSSTNTAMSAPMASEREASQL
ncbi:hypothetical protein D3C81_1521410 [compost metagenome]